MRFPACIALGLLVVLGFAQSWHTPKPGSIERKTVLDALRKPVERKAKQGVLFTQVQLRVQGQWAFVSAISMDRANKKLVLGDAATEGLLKKKGRTWKVLEWGTASDTSFNEMIEKKYPQVPTALYKY